MVLNVTLNTRRSQQPAEVPAPVRVSRQAADPFSFSTSMRDELLLSAKITDSEASPIILERLLSNVESFVDPSQKLLVQGGKSEFDIATSKAAGTSPEAIADRLVEGITGYIFRAWRSRKSKPTDDDIEEFRSQVFMGFDKGLADARDILDGLQALTGERSAELSRLDKMVRESLNAFFGSLPAQFHALRM